MSKNYYWTSEQDELVKKLREATEQPDKDRFYNQLQPAFDIMIDSIIKRYGYQIVIKNDIEERKAEIVEKIIKRIINHDKDINYSKSYSFFSNIAKNHLIELYRIGKVTKCGNNAIQNSIEYSNDIVNENENRLVDVINEDELFNEKTELTICVIINHLLDIENDYLNKIIKFSKKGNYEKSRYKNLLFINYLICYIKINEKIEYKELLINLCSFFDMRRGDILKIFNIYFKIKLTILK